MISCLKEITDSSKKSMSDHIFSSNVTQFHCIHNLATETERISSSVDQISWKSTLQYDFRRSKLLKF